MRKSVTMIGSPRQTSMYERMTARLGRKRIVSTVPSVIPISRLPASAIAATLSVPGSPSFSMYSATGPTQSGRLMKSDPSSSPLLRECEMSLEQPDQGRERPDDGQVHDPEHRV